ncbi:uncharacterized protein [Dermacentor andersoni]|uniref:uncharacterized protein isoform X2 n=1 Tax=Dermacentor andersoni TaxID=34620 RepID=UPI0024163FEF|nr:uncharacterized protein LOC126534106 isoform X2 [Dermacentor andersoni]
MSVPVNLKDAMKETHELLDLSDLVKAPSFFDVVRYLMRQSMQIGVSTLFHSIFVYELGRNMLFLGRGSSLRNKLNTPFNSGEGRHYFEVTLQRLASRGLQSTSFYLATNLVAGVAGMLSQRDDIAKSEVAKAHFCLQFTHKCLTLTWAYLASRYASTPSSISVLHAMLANIQGVVTEQPDTFTWMEKVARDKTADMLHRTTLRVIAGSGFNVSRIKYPEDLPPFAADDSFLKVLVVALRLQYTVMSASPPTRLEMLISDLEFDATVKYVPEKQYIVLPTLYQVWPHVATSRGVDRHR